MPSGSPTALQRLSTYRQAAQCAEISSMTRAKPAACAPKVMDGVVRRQRRICREPLQSR
jgi:hypothetical protein